MGTQSLAVYLAAIEREINEYESSALAMVGFAGLFEFEPSSKHRRPEVKVLQGRRFDTSAANPISPSTQVRPDLTIQVGEDRGSLAELQIGLPRDEQLWSSSLDQLRKYDDDLTGWATDTGRLEQHDVIYLIEVSRGPRFAEYVAEQSATGGWHFQRPFAVVSFTRATLQVKEFLHYRLESGGLLDAVLQARLKLIVPVPLPQSAVEYSTRKLWDHRPPDCYLLLLAWETVILPRAAESPFYPRARVNQPVTVEVSIEQIQQLLEQYYGFTAPSGAPRDPRQPTVPDRAWIRSGLALLQEAGILNWLDQGAGTARVRFKKSYNLDFFKQLEAEARLAAAVAESQTELFSEKPDAGEQAM